eukprot:2612-Heterococcus_DN1.PRE.3
MRRATTLRSIRCVLAHHAAVARYGAAAVQAIAASVGKNHTPVVPGQSLSTMSARTADDPAVNRLQDAGAEHLLDLWAPLSVREHYDQMDAWRNRASGKVSTVKIACI